MKNLQALCGTCHNDKTQRERLEPELTGEEIINQLRREAFKDRDPRLLREHPNEMNELKKWSLQSNQTFNRELSQQFSGKEKEGLKGGAKESEGFHFTLAGSIRNIFN